MTFLNMARMKINTLYTEWNHFHRQTQNAKHDSYLKITEFFSRKIIISPFFFFKLINYLYVNKAFFADTKHFFNKNHWELHKTAKKTFQIKKYKNIYILFQGEISWYFLILTMICFRFRLSTCLLDSCALYLNKLCMDNCNFTLGCCCCWFCLALESLLSSWSSSVRNSLFGYGIGHPANTSWSQ